MPSRIPFPPEVASVYLDFDWDREVVWGLNVETNVIARAVLDWHLDLPFWSSRRGEMLFDLTPRSVLSDASSSRRHFDRIQAADPRFPLDVMEHRGRVCIMDGLHRLARAVLEARETVAVRCIPRELVEQVE